MWNWCLIFTFYIFHRLVLEKQEKFDGHQQFFAIVQLIGTRKQAENFAYRYDRNKFFKFLIQILKYPFESVFRLELNGQRRRLTWEATPRSIHEGVSSAILNSDCLVFDTSIAQLFADNGNLGINVTISMCWWKNQVISCHWKFALIGKTSVFFVKLLHQLLLLLILIIRWSCLYYEEIIFSLFFRKHKKDFSVFSQNCTPPSLFSTGKKTWKNITRNYYFPFSNF